VRRAAFHADARLAVALSRAVHHWRVAHSVRTHFRRLAARVEVVLPSDAFRRHLAALHRLVFVLSILLLPLDLISMSMMDILS
jgi:hypothetical protein